MEHFDIQECNSLYFGRELNNGITHPFLMETDGGLYVVKALADINENKILINEIICFKLAKLLGLPIPDASFIKIGQDIISANECLIKYHIVPGVHFGSKFVKKSQSNIQPPLLKIVSNKEDIPSIILFDQIIYNDDRARNLGNLLIDIKHKKLLIIDHTHVFKLGTIWDYNQLKIIESEPIRLVESFQGHNYNILLKYVDGYNPFQKIITKIDQITKDDLHWCLENIPLQWQFNDIDKNELFKFLWSRLNRVPEFLVLLQKQCPRWKGGNQNEG